MGASQDRMPCARSTTEHSTLLMCANAHTSDTSNTWQTSAVLARQKSTFGTCLRFGSPQPRSLALPHGLAMLLAAGGCFSPHKDLHSLTVLMPLVDSWAFEGGGTAFWASPAGAVDRELGTVPHDINTTPPTIMLTPPAGTALLFGGAVTMRASRSPQDSAQFLLQASVDRLPMWTTATRVLARHS